MADPVIHIKDAYFFELPKFMWRRHYKSRAEFPRDWIKLDADFQHWEAVRLYHEIVAIAERESGAPGAGSIVVPGEAELLERYEHWLHADHANFGKPLDVYLTEIRDGVRQAHAQWVKANPQRVDRSLEAYLSEHEVAEPWFVRLAMQPGFDQAWVAARRVAGDVDAYIQDPTVPEWGADKIAAYNDHLSGKVLIPQYFGEIRNLHEPESGLCISKFMIVQVVVALIIFVLYRNLAGRIRNGDPPRGRFWNLLEVFLVFIREQIAKPTIGAHDADRFVPLLWSLFLFILGCNLWGLIPGVGTPTGVWGTTFGLASFMFLTAVFSSMRRFGFLGFFLNQIPHMELPLVIGIIIKPMVLAIEVLGLVVKHLVLSIRLLANMVAGHLVLLGIMGLAFGVHAAIQFANAPSWQWWLTATIAVVGSAVFSCLELFVAFLQAYIFTFLSALFIGSVIHHH